MKTVNVAELKNRLSQYLRDVREGEEILIRDRNVPIAKIVPLDNTGDLDAETLALVAAGRLRPGKRRIPESFWSTPAPRIPLKVLVDAVVAEREDPEWLSGMRARSSRSARTNRRRGSSGG